MKHSFWIEISRKAVNHPLMANVIFIDQCYSHFCARSDIPFLLIVGKYSPVEWLRIFFPSVNDNFLLPSKCCTVLWELLFVLVHNHPFHVHSVLVMVVMGRRDRRTAFG